MKYHDNLFSLSLFRSKTWTFNDQVTEVFEDMIQRSVPGYSSIVSMIALLTGRIVRAGTHIYDLGCSIGTTTIAIKRAVRYTDCRIIAVDDSPSMIHQCLLRLRTCDRNISTEVIEGDIFDITIENASLVVLNFTLQFLPLERRQALLKNIYQGLNPGGCLVLSEKFRFRNKTMDTLLFNMHHDFKRANGYSTIEIKRKHHMLEKVMYTDSVETHKYRLAEAGFGYSEIWFQQLNFGSLIAIK